MLFLNVSTKQFKIKGFLEGGNMFGAILMTVLITTIVVTAIFVVAGCFAWKKLTKIKKQQDEKKIIIANNFFNLGFNKLRLVFLSTFKVIKIVQAKIEDTTSNVTEEMKLEIINTVIEEELKDTHKSYKEKMALLLGYWYIKEDFNPEELMVLITDLLKSVALIQHIVIQKRACILEEFGEAGAEKFDELVKVDEIG